MQLQLQVGQRRDSRLLDRSHAPARTRAIAHALSGPTSISNVNSLLSGSFLIKFSSLSAPTKIEELTAGSDEKTQRSPAGNRTQGLANSSRKQDPGFVSRRGCAMFLRLIRRSFLLSLSELKEKRI